jgi:hypothetical protein
MLLMVAMVAMVAMLLMTACRVLVALVVEQNRRKRSD